MAKENRLISVIVPCYNSTGTIGSCLHALFQSDYGHFEVIVVNDGSTDSLCSTIRHFPCRLVNLPRRNGAGYARNIGAKVARGDILFFTDADCLVQRDTLTRVENALRLTDGNTIIGGTYTITPYDDDFFSRFQSVFIHYAEKKHTNNPDYIATHALAMPATLFRRHHGFNNNVLPILEDVEYSHRLKHSGVALKIIPGLEVQHMFNFNLIRSLKNAVKKTRSWIVYSLCNNDLLADSGTASHELKFNTAIFWGMMFLLAVFALTRDSAYVTGLLSLLLLNGIVNYQFIRAIIKAHDLPFTLKALLYYFFIYPVAVSTGCMLGVVDSYRLKRSKKSNVLYKAKEAS